MKVFIISVFLIVVGAKAHPSSYDDEKWHPAGPIDFNKIPRKSMALPPRLPHIFGTPKKTPFEYKKGTKAFDDICGIENTKNDRIVGGEEAEPNEFPWLVALECGGQWFCTGALISDNFVLTAAHCVDGAGFFKVYAGAHDLSAWSEPHRVVIKSRKGWTHPDWDPNTLESDLALIELPEPIEFNDYIRPSCMPSYSDQENTFAGETVTATGWGKLSDSSMSRADTLHFVPDRPVIENSLCKETYDIITDGHLCISSEGGKGVCNGDSGGPLNYPIPDAEKSRYKQIGIASFVSSLGCESELPHGFTRVTEFLEWIETETGIEINP